MTFKVWSWNGPYDWIDVCRNTHGNSYVLLEEIEAETIIQACALAVNKYSDKCLRVSGAGFAIEVGAGSDPVNLTKRLDEVMPGIRRATEL